MPKQLTIRGVPDEVGRRLEELSRERRQSLNRTVLEILEESFSFDHRRRRLERYATWTEEDAESFDRALGAQRLIDDEIWR